MDGSRPVFFVLVYWGREAMREFLNCLGPGASKSMLVPWALDGFFGERKGGTFSGADGPSWAKRLVFVSTFSELCQHL